VSQELLSEARNSSEALQRVLRSVSVQPDAVIDSQDYQLLGPMMKQMVQRELYQKALTLQPLSGRGSWWPIIRESYTGAWQNNVELQAGDALAYYAVYSCVRLITTDVGKLCLRLVEQDEHEVWTSTYSPAFSPVLREPNGYQTINKFVEAWILSKLMHGNAYVLKARDNRGVVIALHVLDPQRVTPLVATDGSVYYELKRDDLSGLSKEVITVPAREIIHDTYIAPYHPLIGLSPIYACGLAASQGLTIQNSSSKFFANGANPGGILTAPGAIGDDTAKRLAAHFNSGAYSGENAGKVIAAGDGLHFEKFTMSAVDAQLIEQLRMTAEQVCGAFGVPPYLVDIGPPPPYANFEPLLLKYHSQCIQSLTTNFEKSLDKGLGLVEKIDGKQFGTEFDIDDLIWMDTATRVASAKTAIEGGGMSPDEARFKYHALGPTPGGKSVLAQQQNYSLAALAKRDANDPFAKPTPAPAAPTPDAEDEPDEDDEDMTVHSYAAALHRKAVAEGLYAA
jgi:HK97 family phage portal protein